MDYPQNQETGVDQNVSVEDNPVIQRRVRPAEVYDAILDEGEEELERGFPALWWSGIAAGLSMGFSVITAAALASALGAAPWTKPIVAAGYTSGFILVILARQQLFTENTITALLPVITTRSWASMLDMLRLWLIVLVANMVGAFIFATATIAPLMLPESIIQEVTVLGHHLFENSPMEMFVKGIAAGWLIASLVWVIPSLKSNKFPVVFFFTWLIGVGGFTHIIAGSIEAFHMLLIGHIGLYETFIAFMLPTLLGNIVGGSAIFSLISYAQVREEM